MVAMLAFWLAYSPVEVVGDAVCPAPAEVSRRLAQMLPATDGVPATTRPSHRARIAPTETGVHLDLLNDEGERIAARDLRADGSCDDLAAALAVVIASLEAELDSQAAARVSLPAPSPLPTAAAVVVDRGMLPSPPPSFAFGLALLASLTGGEVAPGARVDGWLAPAGWRLGVGVAATGTTARSEPVGPGAARWTRLALGAGPEGHFAVRFATLDAHAHLLAARLWVEGVGLPTTASDTSGQLGVGTGLRVGWTWGHASPFIGADLSFWPGHDRLVIGGYAANGELPRVELQLAVGMRLGRFP